MKLDSSSAYWLSMVVSAALHVLVWFAPSRNPARVTAPMLQDRWSTNSIEVSSEPSATNARAAGAAVEPAAAAVPPPVATPTNPVIALPDKTTDAHALRPTAPASTPHARTPRPQPHEPTPPSRPATSTSVAEPASSAIAGTDTSPSQSNSGTMGALELPPGVRYLAHAFTRALPASNYTDAAWTELPAGAVGRTELEIDVDEEGHLGEVKFDPRFPPAAVIERMVKNALLLLKAGVFSVDARSVSAGSERLSIEVSLRDEPAPVAEGDARGLFRKSYEPPSVEHAGHAGFTLNSGRHMEAVVRMLRKR